MPKLFNATCENSQVTATVGEEQVDVAAAIQSEGIGPSEGVLILDGPKAKYFAKTSPDLKTTLENLSSVLSTIASTLTAIGAGMAGSLTAPPPTLGASVSSINAVASTLSTLKDNLR